MREPSFKLVCLQCYEKNGASFFEDMMSRESGSPTSNQLIHQTGGWTRENILKGLCDNQEKSISRDYCPLSLEFQNIFSKIRNAAIGFCPDK